MLYTSGMDSLPYTAWFDEMVATFLNRAGLFGGGAGPAGSGGTVLVVVFGEVSSLDELLFLVG